MQSRAPSFGFYRLITCTNPVVPTDPSISTLSLDINSLIRRYVAPLMPSCLVVNMRIVHGRAKPSVFCSKHVDQKRCFYRQKRSVESTAYKVRVYGSCKSSLHSCHTKYIHNQARSKTMNTVLAAAFIVGTYMYVSLYMDIMVFYAYDVCVYIYYIYKVNQSHYRAEVPRGFQEVKVPRLRDNGPEW